MSSDNTVDLGWLEDLAASLDRTMDSTLESLEQIADAFAPIAAAEAEPVFPVRRRADPKSRARSKRARLARRRNRKR